MKCAEGDATIPPIHGQILLAHLATLRFLSPPPKASLALPTLSGFSGSGAWTSILPQPLFLHIWLKPFLPEQRMVFNNNANRCNNISKTVHNACVGGSIYILCIFKLKKKKKKLHSNSVETAKGGCKWRWNQVNAFQARIFHTSWLAQAPRSVFICALEWMISTESMGETCMSGWQD